MTSIAYSFLAVGVAAIVLSSIFMLLPLLPNQSAFGTFPGENGRISFHRDLGSGNSEIYVMNADGSGLTNLTGNTHFDMNPSWSPDGGKIAFESGDGNSEIYTMNADGSGVKRLTDDPALDVHASWSPDGSKIVFQSDRDGDYEIYVMNAADGSGLTQLTHNNVHDSTPNWSPGGKKIAFASFQHGGSISQIYVMNSDGTAQTRLTDDHNDPLGFPSWSPNGTKIAFSTSQEGFIYVMNAADGSELTQLTDMGSSQPSWSPDGQKIAFQACNSVSDCSQQEIYVMNAADGSEVTKLTSNFLGEGDEGPDWGTNATPAPPPPEEDTTPPVLTVPNNKVVEATSEQGAEVTYKVSAEDNVDGNATLEEDGSITQDDAGGDIDIFCEPTSGTTFPIGNTTVQCSATDEAGNRGTESFTVTVNPPTPSPPAPIPKQIIDRLISTIENLDDNVPQSIMTNLTAVLKQVSNILSDDNPNNDESACGRFDSFINEVNADERRDTLTADQADELRTQAEDISDELFLDC